MIVMKNNDFKSSKRILPSKKMVCTASLLISKEIEKYIQKKENQLVDKLQQAGFLSTKLTVRQADKLEEELTNILQSHNEEFISLLKKYQEQGKTLEDVLNALPNFNQSRATAVKSAINTAVYNNLTEMIPKVANKYLKNIDGELEIKQMTKTTVNWIKTWSKNLADIMNINTEEMLRNTLVNGINGGIGIDEISRNMVDNGALKTRVRARTTAVTEVLTANRIAAQEAIIQAPETNRKQWKHSGSYKIKPRENHIKMNGQVVLKTQPFKMIGADGKTYYPMVPGDTSLPPAERINCHCIVSPILDDSVFNMTLEERQELQQKCIQEYDEFNGLNTDNSLDNSQESGIINSGAISGGLNPYEPAAIEHAIQYYESVRHMTTDTYRISKSTGISKDKIDKIKNHIFINEHDLITGRSRFYPSYDMAVSWQRLINGDYLEKDMVLLRHEYCELRYMEKGLTQDKAHIKASRRYNYQKYCL